MLISRTNKTKFTYRNYRSAFTIGDFHVGGGYKKTESFDLDIRIMQAIIIISDFYRLFLLELSSTRRTIEYNRTIPDASETSKHLDGQAIDFRFGKWDKRLHPIYEVEIRSKGKLYKELYALGIREFLFYDTWNHIAIMDTVESRIGSFEKKPEDKIKENITELSEVVITPVAKEYYDYYHQDSQIKT
ncbi:MAG: hypothetical protein Q8T08_19200, partial [Ignavibacteria bacterium]|nr:hypothetical protein [Ignavibacteria bacterium]